MNLSELLNEISNLIDNLPKSTPGIYQVFSTKLGFMIVPKGTGPKKATLIATISQYDRAHGLTSNEWNKIRKIVTDLNLRIN